MNQETVLRKNIGKKIKLARAKSNYTQEELADKLGVSRQTINSLENGKYNPSIQLAFKLAKFFNLSIEALFIFEEDWNGK